MKNLFVWIVLISTAALGVAVAQPEVDQLAAMKVSTEFRLPA